jgi:hypothetical protein
MPSPTSRVSILQPLIDRDFQIEYINHARAILETDFPEVLVDVRDVLGQLSIPIESLVRGGGGEHDLTQRLRRAFSDRNWFKHRFEIQRFVDGTLRESTTHEVDHVRKLEGGNVAMELEWNNKDPFFDRDLENFKRLHAEAAISVGVMITRGRSLQDALRRRILAFADAQGIQGYDQLVPYKISPTPRQRENVLNAIRSRKCSFSKAWSDVFVADKFGEATTHWRKLEARILNGVGSPCPLLLIGLPEGVLSDEKYEPGKPRLERPGSTEDGG